MGKREYLQLSPASGGAELLHARARERRDARQRPLIDRGLGESGKFIGLGNFVKLLGDSLFTVVNYVLLATGAIAKKIPRLGDPF